MPQPYPLNMLTRLEVNRIEAVAQKLVSEGASSVDPSDLPSLGLPCTDPVYDYLSEILSRATMRNVVQLNVIDDRPKERGLMDGADDCSPFERNLRVTAVRASKQSAAPLILPYPCDLKNDPAMEGLTPDQRLMNLKAIEIQERTRKHAIQTLSHTIAVSAKAERLHRRRLKSVDAPIRTHLQSVAIGEIDATPTQLRALIHLDEHQHGLAGTQSSQLSHLSDADIEEQLMALESGSEESGLSGLPTTKTGL